MPEQVALTATARAGDGKGEARQLRRRGRTPAIAYGSDLSPSPISVNALELFHALHTHAGANAVIRLDIDGNTHLAMAREVQRHPVRREILHVDFVTIRQNVKVQVEVPLVVEGDAVGVREGGVLEHSLYTLPINVLPLEVPDEIVVEVADLEIGDVLRVGDLSVGEGVEVLEDPERTVVSVVPPTAEAPEAQEEAPLEPLEGAAAEAQGGSEAAGESA